jgi:hypothetical protein
MFEAFIGAIYFLQAGVFAMFVFIERNRGGAWQLKHVVLMVAAVMWPLVLALALVVASVKAMAIAFTVVSQIISGPKPQI